MRIIVIDGMGMKARRIKAAWHIFAQCKKAGSIRSRAVFKKDTVEITDIEDHGRYYGVLLFVPSVASK